MQIEVVTWQAATVEIAKLLIPVISATIPAAFAVIATVLTLRHQRRVEETKIDGQTKLRARELMFNSYQQQMDKNAEEVKLLGQKVGELSMAAQLSDDQQEVNQALVAFVGLITSLTNPIKGSLEGIQDELKRYGLLEARKEKIETIRRHIEVDFRNATPDIIFREYSKITVALGTVAAIQQEILDCKRRELFRDYLPDEKEATTR